MSRTKCSLLASYMSRLDSLAFLWPVGKAAKPLSFAGSKAVVMSFCVAGVAFRENVTRV